MKLRVFLSHTRLVVALGAAFLAYAVPTSAGTTENAADGTLPNADRKVAGIVARELALAAQRQAGDDKWLSEFVLQVYGPLSPEKKAAAKHLHRDTMTHPAMSDRMAAAFEPLAAVMAPTESLRSAAFQVVQHTLQLGLVRLPSERLAAYFRHVVGFMRGVQPDVCKNIVMARLAPLESNKEEVNYLASLPTERFKAVMSLYREASLAELEGYPDRVLLNAEQAKLADAIFKATAKKRVEANVPEAVRNRVYSSLGSAPSHEVCRVATEHLLSMLDMPEPYRRWQMTRHILHGEE